MYARTTTSETYVDVCSFSGASVVLQQVDEQLNAFTVPMTLVYWGETLVNPRMVVSSNGWMSFAYNGTQNYTTGAIPSAAEPNGVLAAQWSNLVTGVRGVCAGLVGEAPSRRLVVQWADARYVNDPNSLLNFEIILHEGSGVVDILYQTARNAQPAPVGLENRLGTVGIGGCNTPECVAASGVAVRFAPVR